ncbi:hypothetical protein TanjilG_01866 [Lupinus angustifolius]|uniref:RING-type E3 ubiquitin transferase n=1 Tax=Lupinus angustifolius TaxID=3871 RepID=A0A1J7HUY7_LUPAN|nr:PREDICTED: probable E3 ubiquitin-protein ligase RHA1A [Lupinus angustifolius]OIW16627.1 hypothetical protein TanjilG_01866 [Lupinus angustifolius]
MADDLFEIDLFVYTRLSSTNINEDIGVVPLNYFSLDFHDEDIDDDLANFISIDINQNIDQQHACNTLASIQNSLERLKYEEDASLSKEQCAICLEEFCNGDESKLLVRTQCLHVFHEDCMIKWLQRCSNVNQSYSCPMCRCQISSKN